MTSRATDRHLLYSSSLDHSRRSLVSESESDVGSLLSGLSQARKIPDRRKLSSSNGRGGRSNPSSSAANGLGNAKAPSRRAHSPDYQREKQKNELYRKEVDKIILIQAIARGYTTRFAYRSRLTMEKTKRKFFAIQIQCHVRGFLQRRQFQKMTGNKTKLKSKRCRKSPSKQNVDIEIPRAIGSLKRNRGRGRVNKNLSPASAHLESDSERSEASFRLDRLTAQRMDCHTTDRLGESESDVGSIMSNLSVARKVPDRRRKREENEKKVTKIQALARGYIQRFLYRSMVAMERTKRKYAAITIQANARGYIQRKHCTGVSRKHVAPRRERLTSPPVLANEDGSSSGSQRKRRKTKRSKIDGTLHQKGNRSPRKRDKKLYGNIRKPGRYRRDMGEEDNLLPRELTIRKPRRHLSNSDQSGDLPPKQLTIKMPRRLQSGPEDSACTPPRRLMITATNHRQNDDRHKDNVELSPPRKLMLRVKKARQDESDLDRSERSIEHERRRHNRRERLMSLGGTSDSRFGGESESDVGSLISGLSQARKVPDRRLKGEQKGLRSKRNAERQVARARSATMIQALGRGYIKRFAFKSRLIMEQTKKKFFAIQIQALARGFLVRIRLAKNQHDLPRRKVKLF